MRARDVMTTRLITATPDMHLKEAARLLVEHGVSALPVLDDAGALVGILSERDLLSLETTAPPQASITEEVASDHAIPATVGAVMTRDVEWLPDAADVSEVARLMLARGLKHVPILSEGRLVGIVSRRDLVKLLARPDEEIRRRLTEIFEEETLLSGRLRVEVQDGVVTLHGGEDDPMLRTLAERAARAEEGVVDVRVALGSAREDARSPV